MAVSPASEGGGWIGTISDRGSSPSLNALFLGSAINDNVVEAESHDSVAYFHPIALQYLEFQHSAFPELRYDAHSHLLLISDSVEYRMLGHDVSRRVAVVATRPARRIVCPGTPFTR